MITFDLNSAVIVALLWNYEL